MRFCLSLLLAAAIFFPAAAGTPPAAELLPPDTLALFSIPDWDKAAAYWNASPQGRLWQDPAMRSFREKLMKRWKEDLVVPLERRLDVKLADYAGLLHGQVTLAVTQNGWGAHPESETGLLLLIDTKGKQEALKSRLAEIKKKWAEAGKPLKSDKVRDLEMTTFILTEQGENKGNAAPEADDEMEGEESRTLAAKLTSRKEITLGQSGDLLLVGSSIKDLEGVLARLSGGLAPALSEQAAYQTSQAAFREALAFGWGNVARLYETVENQIKAASKSFDSSSPLAPPPERMLSATGLGGLKTIVLTVNGNNEGFLAEVRLGIPESRRQGLFKLLVSERKDAAPPPFVSAEAIKFGRWRINGQRAWNTLENIIAGISPELNGLLKMGLDAAGKDKDPNFDLRKTLIGNLGDDFITVQKAPRSASPADSSALPSLFLIGSPNPEQLVQGLKAASALMPMASGEATVKEREFLGRKIYSLALPDLPGPDEPAEPSPSRSLSFVAMGGYAALSVDSGLIEEYMRSSDTSGRPLHELAGLSEAAEKVGGMSTGLFGYQNYAGTARLWLDSAKKQNAVLDKLLSLGPLAGGKARSSAERSNSADALDLSLLPPFEQIAKYFHFFVYSLSSSEESLNWKLFAPVPPQLK